MRDARSGGDAAGGTTASRSPGAATAPGKQTLVGALGGGAQVTGAPGGAQTGGLQSPANTKGEAPPPFYQYQAGTTHANDCGPASLLAILRMLHAEANLISWIVAHRPTGDALTGYLAHYQYATATDAVGPQEELDVVRACVSANGAAIIAGTYRLSTPGDQTDTVLDVGQVRTALFNLLRAIGAAVPATGTAEEAAVMPLASEQGLQGIGGDDLDEATHPGNRSEVLRFLYRNCAQDRATVILGSPLENVTDANGRVTQAPVAWGWGGATPSAGGRQVGERSGAQGGHFVIVYSFNRGTKLFTILDPSYDAAQSATPDQVLAFVANKHAAVSNMLPISLDTVASWLPTPVTAPPPAQANRPAAPQRS